MNFSASALARLTKRVSPATTPKEEPAKDLVKGKTLGGPCNRTACQIMGATWWNTATQAYYCGTCAGLINQGAREFGKEAICSNHATKTRVGRNLAE